MHTIYLDHLTTTPLAASVREAMLPFLQNMYGHPSSNHWMGRVAAEAVEDARSSLAALLDCYPNEIIFTASGTESVNLGILGAARAVAADTVQPHCITSNLEHIAVRACINQLVREGWQVTVVACDADGVVQPREIEKALRDSTRLISIIHASDQIGTIQPLSDIAAICHGRQLYLHTDAAQSVGKIACSPQALGVDLLSLSGHKFYAPKGIGALYVRSGVPVESVLFGDGCESGLRPGTASISNIAGLGQAAKLAVAGLASSIDRVSKLRDRFCEDLRRLTNLPLVVHGERADRLPGILSIELPGIFSSELEQRLPEVHMGPPLHAHFEPTVQSQQLLPRDSGAFRTSQALWESLGMTEQRTKSRVRLSMGWSTSPDELSQAAQMIAAAYESLKP